MINKEFNNIEIPEDIDSTIDLAIDRIRKEDIKFKKRKRKIVGIVAASLVLVFTIGISNPVIADNIPILKDIFKVFQNNYQDKSIIPNNNYSEHSTFVGITKENNGVKMTIEEIIYDGEDLYMSYKIESEKPFGYTTMSYPVNYEVDPVESTINITEDTEFETEEITRMWLEQKNTVNYLEEPIYNSDNWLDGMIVNDNTFIGIIKYEVPTLEDGSKPQEFKTSINIEEVTLPIKIQDYGYGVEGNDKYSVKGNWNFDVDVKLYKRMEEIIEVNEIKNGFKLEKIIKTPFYITAKVVPMKEENQKNIITNSDKVPQMQHGYIIDGSGKEYGYGMPTCIEEKLKEGDLPGTMYINMERSINDKEEFFQVEVIDETILGEECSRMCEIKEHHENSPHPKTFNFDTKIYNN